MALLKRKLSVSLDEDLVAALEASGDPVSVQVNEAVRNEIERRQQQQALARFCDRYVEETGPWSDEDEAEIQRIMHMLGG
jgi:post-segregation antitoxin (ccd killing protein)